MSTRRYRPRRDGAAVAIVDDFDGEVICFAKPRTATSLARFLEQLDPTGDQLDALLGERHARRLLRRIELRSPATCHRCGATMQPGTSAFWHPVSKVVRHVGRCKPRRDA
jgi:hypothetical protein